jgi:hypothetical protein
MTRLLGQRQTETRGGCQSYRLADRAAVFTNTVPTIGFGDVAF